MREYQNVDGSIYHTDIVLTHKDHTRNRNWLGLVHQQSLFV